METSISNEVITFKVENFPHCLRNNNKITVKIEPNRNNGGTGMVVSNDYIFFIEGTKVYTLRFVGFGFGSDSRTDYIDLSFEKARLMKKVGIDISTWYEKKGFVTKESYDKSIEMSRKFRKYCESYAF